MASYRIVLNLSGNAKANLDKFIDSLEKAKRGIKELDDAKEKSARSERTRVSHWETSISSSSGLGSVYKLGARLAPAVGATIMTLQAGRALARNFILPATKYQYTMGAQALRFGADFLASEDMGAGIRYLQRRQQARLGLGKDFARISENAELMAAAYGFDPSVVLSSMNVLKGLKIGSTNERMNAGMAQMLTKAGGLISQQSGSPVERVLTNFQQMFSQTVPTIRDIREMLNAAPILSRYAMDEMERRGVSGVSPLDWFKEHGNIISAITRFIAENPAIATMEARGVVQRSKTQFFAKLAENPNWLQVASKYESIMGSAANFFSNVLSYAVDSKTLGESLERLNILFENSPQIIDKFSEKLDNLVNKLIKFAGIDIGDTDGAAAKAAQDEKLLKEHIRRNLSSYRLMYSQKTDEPLGNDEQFFNRVLRDLSGGSYVHDVAPLSEYTNMSIGERSEALDFMGVKSPFLKASALRNYSAWVSAHQGATAYGATMFGGSPYFTGRGGAIVDDDLIRSTLSRKLDSGTDTTTPTYIPGFGGNGDGSDISGFGRDRKALTINFNAPIVDWDSNITTGDPQDVVNEVSETIEGAASRAIQIALLGASQKMTTRF